MKKLYLFIAIFIVLVSCQTDNKQSEYVLVIQGGAGYGAKKDLSPEREQAYIETLTKVLETGAEILKNNGSSLDAVEASIRIMEDSPLFNAGKGAVFNEKGGNEMDASIMDGKDLNAGAVACVSTVSYTHLT
ncbi:MAG: isoaspartyl peptidase/L-asparaginase, partial [Bacteroidetes bacterium]|nr:isoaspartyl peptidase/L-asparaginase [Bacteroidota bacterium]